MNHSQIQLRLSVKIKLLQGQQFGTGVLWKADWTEEQYIILTCKHNLCHSQQDCELTCGTNCNFLNDLNLEEIVITDFQQEIISIQKILVSPQKDVALFILTNFDSTSFDSIFTRKLVEIAFWSDDFYDARVGFLGFPALFSTRAVDKQFHCFDGYITFIHDQFKTFDIRNSTSFSIDTIAGVSGSGLFGVNGKGQLVLLGIITDFKGLAAFKGTYLLEEMTTWFSQIQDPQKTQYITKAVPSNTDAKTRDKIRGLKKYLTDIETLIFKIDDRIENSNDENEKEEFKNRIESLEKMYLKTIRILKIKLR
jgi:hypothetical protein